MAFILEYLQFLNSIYNYSQNEKILSVLDTLQLIVERNLLDASPKLTTVLHIYMTLLIMKWEGER